MFQNDYIMRIIEQLSGCIARIMNLKKQDAAQAEMEIEQAYKQLLGINPGLLYMMSVENIVSLLNRDGGNWHKLIGAANLLLADAELCMQNGQEEAAKSRGRKAYELIALAIADGETEGFAEQYIDIERFCKWQSEE